MNTLTSNDGMKNRLIYMQNRTQEQVKQFSKGYKFLYFSLLSMQWGHTYHQPTVQRFLLFSLTRFSTYNWLYKTVFAKYYGGWGSSNERFVNSNNWKAVCVSCDNGFPLLIPALLQTFHQVNSGQPQTMLPYTAGGETCNHSKSCLKRSSRSPYRW